ncbi:hypothetical protein KPH14_009496 [Odynerus spinipes]|uniref:RRM domain-containing protein n=1 Tax=Odynerus spinipes TaxID=1348599 RepID=A0AAD9RPQ4_9HYME|nr:hypothetical protein KPH14_009496 [Odynerus spinipes]
MSKLYVGNLSSECNENALRQLFQDHNLACTTILVKRGGYAFVDCADQSTADRAIDKLNESKRRRVSARASRGRRAPALNAKETRVDGTVTRSVIDETVDELETLSDRGFVGYDQIKAIASPTKTDDELITLLRLITNR